MMSEPAIPLLHLYFICFNKFIDVLLVLNVEVA